MSQEGEFLSRTEQEAEPTNDRVKTHPVNRSGTCGGRALAVGSGRAMKSCPGAAP
jgi:hypothetical protein